VHPSGSDSVTVHHSGWTKEGQRFESTVLLGKPDVYRLDQLTAPWREALSFMTEGEKRRVWIPAAMASGDAARGSGQAQSDLVYDLELVKLYQAPPVPVDVRAPPKDARRTGAHIPFRVLREGDGQSHPDPTTGVEVVYTAWSTDGKLLVTNTNQDEPLRFPVMLWPEGLAIALKTMVTGDLARFWIPAKLAVAKAGAPPGGVDAAMAKPGAVIVYDIELKAMQPPRWALRRR
jgi:peptidylprolyl isomerase